MDTRDIEASVLGSLLIDPGPVAPLVMQRARPGDFYDAALRHLFEAAYGLWLEQKPIDPVTVNAAAGGGYDEALSRVMAITPTAANVEAYLDELIKGARLRELHVLGLQIANAKDLPAAREALESANALLVNRPARRAATWQELVSRYLDRQNDKTPPDYLDWGLEKLNEVVSLRAGRFVVIGADSSVGKTAFALQAAYHIARSGKRVAFYSYETDLDDSADRIMANAVDVALPRSKHKALSSGDIRRVLDEGDAAARIPLEIVETAGCTVTDLRTEILAHRIEVAFIDYVQLIPGVSEADTRWETVTRNSMALHTMAQQLGCTVVALSQVTLPQPTKGGVRPTIDKHSLRESRQLTNDADLVLLLDLADPTFPEGPRVLKVAKNKDGKLGGMYLDFDAEHMRFKPGRPPMQTGEPIPSKEELAARASKPKKSKPAAAIPGQLYDLPEGEGGDLPF